MKRISIKYILFALFFILFSIRTFADEFTVNGITYLITDIDKVSVRGTNAAVAMVDGEICIPSKVQYNNKEYNITEIQRNAFSNSNVCSIVIPNTVERIENGAISNCPSLASLTIPFTGVGQRAGGMRYEDYLFGQIFGSYQFTGYQACDQLTNDFYLTSPTYTKKFYIPASLKTVTVTGGESYNCAFSNCSMIETVNLAESLSHLATRMFYGCTSLKNINIPETVKNVPRDCFRGCI